MHWRRLRRDMTLVARFPQGEVLRSLIASAATSAVLAEVSGLGGANATIAALGSPSPAYVSASGGARSRVLPAVSTVHHSPWYESELPMSRRPPKAAIGVPALSATTPAQGAVWSANLRMAAAESNG